MKTINNLRQTINLYMKRYINGDEFEDEQDFENDIRAMLEDKEFVVLPRVCVNNAQKMVEGLYSDTGRQIPDITVNCADGQVFWELKFCRDNTAYNADIEKVQNYLAHEECEAAGVLFLDDNKEKWEPCLGNSMFTYFWELAE